MRRTLNREPRQWQVRALAAWKANDRRGIARVVTGGGKTMFALQCALDAFEMHDALCVGIVVPSVALLDQWYVDLQGELDVAPDEIHVVRGGTVAPAGVRFCLVVLNTARTRGLGLPPHRPAMLVVDECHRAGAAQSQRALQGKFVATLGLSATPEREYDRALDEVLVPRLGPIVFNYSYVDAAADGVIAPFELINVEVPLTPDEHDRYTKLSRDVTRAWHAYRQGKISEDRFEDVAQAPVGRVCTSKAAGAGHGLDRGCSPRHAAGGLP